MSDTFSYHAEGRSRKTAVVLVLIWAALLGLWVVLEAATWIVAFLALFTLPALADLIRNPNSGLSLTPEDITWFTGKRRAEVALEEVDHIRLDTRLDFSVKATVILKTGAKLRLPFEATPPHQAFEDALNAQGVTTKRYHFQLMQ